MSKILAYGDFYISKGRAGYAPMKPGLLGRSGPARRIALSKAKPDIADLRDMLDFFERWEKLIEQEKVV